MDEMEELQMTCFEIIGYVGTAKSCYINAISKAKEGAFDEAEALIKEGDVAYNGGHDVHMKLLQADAAGERNGEAPLILLHAEDQMAGTETCKLMALNFIDTYRELQELKAKLA
ncbi:PTS lactose/cellobiose transporter subunit IIA [Collinsella sp. An2]|uniref:PTS lactose/cellobiose transporter subunit IIA n=1 Tax=Collinsella sp. An2 TaxID=1965585 RepID=UPI00194DC3D1|nr:PTS lactose/cellobiose transporter subunit IIA [Collinsella sp. An2]